MGSNCVFSEFSNEILNIWYLVCDVNIIGEENEVVIWIEGVFCVIGFFDEIGCFEFFIGGCSSFLVKFVGEICFGMDDEGDLYFLYCGEILVVWGEFVFVDVVGIIYLCNWERVRLLEV